MSRGGRVALIVAAWVGPLGWLAFWPFTATSDGTVVSRPAAVLDEGRWDESLRVLETYGDTPLRPGDEILQIEGTAGRRARRPRRRRPPDRGDVLSYRVRRQAGARRDPGGRRPAHALPRGRRRARGPSVRRHVPRPPAGRHAPRCSGREPGRGWGNPGGGRAAGRAERAAVRHPGRRLSRGHQPVATRRGGGGRGPGARRCGRGGVVVPTTAGGAGGPAAGSCWSRRSPRTPRGWPATQSGSRRPRSSRRSSTCCFRRRSR